MDNSKKTYIHELEMCLDLWEKQGHCEFGIYTECTKCAAPYLLLKLISGEVMHGKDMPRLSLNEWKSRLEELK